MCLRVTCNTHDQVDFRLSLSFYYYIYLYVAKHFLLKDFLLSNVTVTNYFIIFLQIIDIKNSYWLWFEPSTNIIFFYLIISLNMSIVCKKSHKIVYSFSIFPFLFSVRRFITSRFNAVWALSLPLIGRQIEMRSYFQNTDNDLSPRK